MYNRGEVDKGVRGGRWGCIGAPNLGEALLSRREGVSADTGTLEMKASSSLATSAPPLPPTPPPSLRLTVIADFSKEIFRPPTCSLCGYIGNGWWIGGHVLL